VATINNTKTTTAITSTAIIGGIIYGRVKQKSIISTFAIAVVFGFVAYIATSALEENFK
jgi:predicted MFS family arabinose efflux permease